MTPYLRVEDFADAVSHNNVPRILVMLVAYFDGTRTEVGRPYVAVAGCLVHLDQWKLFQPAWQAILDREGLEFFHMTDFEAYGGGYKDWTRERHNNCLNKLGEVIVPRTQFAFGRGVAIDDWEYAQAKNGILAHWSAFAFCANQCLHGIATWASEHHYTGQILYIFENGDGYNEELYKLKDNIENSRTRMMRFRWGGFHILPKQSIAPWPLTPLQAADIWAFEARKEWENKYAVGEGGRTRPLRYSIRMLLEGSPIKHDFGFSNREDLVVLKPYWLEEQE